MKKRIIAIITIIEMLLLTFSASAEVTKSKKVEDKKIALTFDDGPTEKTTDKILSVLDKYNIKATFFVLGENVEKHPEKLKLISEKGHEIGNHTFSHIYISKVSNEKLISEIKKTEKIIFDISGVKAKSFRPPGGYYNDSSVKTVEDNGYQCYIWSVDSRDWSIPNFQSMIRNVINETTDGSILLFHDHETKGFKTPEALEVIIPRLLAKGFQFVTISEL